MGGRGPRVSAHVTGNEVDDDVVRDVAEVMTSLCARSVRAVAQPEDVPKGAVEAASRRHDSRLPGVTDFNL